MPLLESRRSFGALLVAVLVVYSSVQPVSGQDRPDTVLENSEPSMNLLKSVYADDFSGGLCAGGLVYRGFENCPVNAATLALDVGLDGLTVKLPSATGSAAALAACTAPFDGSEINPDDPDNAGKNGFRVDLDNVAIPDDMTEYSVQLEGYWGTASTDNWATAAIPITFKASVEGETTTVTACTNFDVTPVNCSTVVVEYKGGGSPGEFECPAGDLFSVDNATITLRTLVTHATCQGGTCGDDSTECAPRERATAEFVFASVVNDLSMNGACTAISGSSPFSAKKILIRPKLSTCNDGTTCGERQSAGGLSDSHPAMDAVYVAGGNTPPIRSIKLLGEASAERAGQASAAAVAGTFTILDEAYCTFDEIGACKDGFDNDCDGLIDLLDPDCDGVPTVSEWGLVLMALVLCMAATLVMRRRSSYTATLGV